MAGSNTTPIAGTASIEKVDQKPASTADTNSATKSKTPNESKKSDKDIRHHPKYGFLYEVHRYNALYHLVERLGAPEKKRPLLKRLKTKYREINRQLPLLKRFILDIIPLVGRRRLLLCYLGDFILQSVVPIAHTAAGYDLAQVTIEAIGTRRMNWKKASQAISQDLLSYLLEQCLSRKLEESKAKLVYRYRSSIRETIMQARLGLDSVTSANEKVIAHFKSAESLLQSNWGGSYVLDQVSKMINVCARITSHVLIMKRITKKFDSRLATFSFLVKLTFTMTRYLSFVRYGSHVVTAITDENYRRSEIMANASKKADAQDQVLGLRDYFYQQYKAAQQAVGDASPAEPNVWDEDLLHPWRSLMFKFIEKFNSMLLYMLLALHTIRQPLVSVTDASTIINDLNALSSASSWLSYEVYQLFTHSRVFMNNLTPIEKFYTLSKIKPLLRKNKDAISYKREDSAAKYTSPMTMLSGTPQVCLQGGDTTSIVEQSTNGLSSLTTKQIKIHGMQIDFESVSFTYPNKLKKALDNVSFRIEPGQLCSVVGFSGSGKSTLIALLVRLHDPDEGRILINGIDIKRYDPEDLYRNISYLFQTTKKPNFTIREFIRLGRLDATDEEIEEAVKESGADEIIKKFPRGMDTELEQRHYSDKAVTVEMLVKRAQNWDESELKWRGKNAANDDEDDEAEDPRTDAQTLQKLFEVSAMMSDMSADAVALDKWTTLARSEELPDPRPDEEIILAPGYDAKKAEEGEKKNQADVANFSGGEWAKIVLARSFLRNSADLVILDEFSAALDPLSEADIFEKFMKRRGQRTIIAVTHRFHLAYRSDLILFLQDGQLKEKGGHHDLMKLTGKYKEMYLKTTNVSGKEVGCQTIEESKVQVDMNAAGPEGKEGVNGKINGEGASKSSDNLKGDDIKEGVNGRFNGEGASKGSDHLNGDGTPNSHSNGNGNGNGDVNCDNSDNCRGKVNGNGVSNGNSKRNK